MNELISAEFNEKPFQIDYRENFAIANKMLLEIEMDLEQDNDAELNHELQRVDNMRQDVLHMIELYNFNASEGYKFAKMLQVISKARRRIKDRMEARIEMKKILATYKKTGFKAHLTSAVSRAEKKENHFKSRTYKLRELTELEEYNNSIKKKLGLEPR
ncbi:hypothetical protein [Bacillus phage vB_BanS-Thrax1]|nr:hypothetical protein [Bacillus phage vB_BanS-Thrax1]